MQALRPWTRGRFLHRLDRDEPALVARYTRPDLENYASGIETTIVRTTDGDKVRVHSHSGEDPGYFAYFVWIPTTDTTLVMISNTDYGQTSSDLRALSPKKKSTRAAR